MFSLPAIKRNARQTEGLTLPNFPTTASFAPYFQHLTCKGQISMGNIFPSFVSKISTFAILSVKGATHIPSVHIWYLELASKM
jgi:hypothetical protein